MKKSETKVRELQAKLGMEEVAPEEFIQFVHDTIECMPEPWKDPMTRAYLAGSGQLFDETTGKPLSSDSRFHIMTEHSRRGFITLVELFRKHPETVEWLKENA